MKLLLIDLETSPHTGYTWGKYEQNVIAFTDYSQIICMAWKWYGEKEVYAECQADLKGYRPGKLEDKKLVKDLWELLDKADVVLAHNGDRFDVKVANARFVYHNLVPPSPYQTLDTKKIAKRIGMFPSNKLDDLGQYFQVGQKMQTGGFDLWAGCIAGYPESWSKMKRYNKQDIVLLEKIYMRLLPWTTNHPNYNVYGDTHFNCPNCGGYNVEHRGFSMNRTGRRQRYQCKDCGAWSAGRQQSINPILR